MTARESSLARRAVDGVAWMAVNSAGQIALQVIVLAVLARLISPQQFGLVSVALITVTISEVLADSGIGAALVQRPRITPSHVRAAFTMTLLLALGVWGLIVLAAPAIASFFHNAHVAPLLRVCGLSFVIRSLTVGDFLLARRMHFRAISMIELASYAFGYAVVSVVLASRGWGAWAIVYGQVGQALVYTTLYWIMSPHPFLPCLAPTPVKDLLSYGSGHLLGRSANWVAIQGDNFVVGRTLGPLALGLYGRAYALMSMPANLCGQVASEVLFPAMASVQGDAYKLRVAYLHSVALVALIALPASALVAIVGDEAVRVLLGPSWVPLETAFQIMTLGILFRTSYKLSDSLARATGAVYRRAWRQGVYAAAVLGGAYVGHWWGIRGVALGVVGAVTVNYLLMAHLSLHLIGARWRDLVYAHWAGVIVTLAAVIACAPCVMAARALDVPATGVLAVATLSGAFGSLLVVRYAPRWGLTRLASLTRDTLALVPQRLGEVVGKVCGPAYALAEIPSEAAA